MFTSHEPPIILHAQLRKKQAWLNHMFAMNKPTFSEIVCSTVRVIHVVDIHSRLPFFSSSTRSLESPAGSSRSTEGPQATSPGVLLCAA